MRPCKQAAQNAADTLHCCKRGERPTVETIWHRETSAMPPHSLHDFFCMEFPFPRIEQTKERSEFSDIAILKLCWQCEHCGALPHTPASFTLSGIRFAEGRFVWASL